MNAIATGVVIDGAVPRSDRERVATLHSYLETLSPAAADLFRDDLEHGTDDGPGTGGEWSEVEDEVLDKINDVLPREFVCALGETCPGDVIVREAGEAR